MKRIFVAMSMNYWGRGNTIAEAMKQLKKAGGTCAKGKMLILNAPEGASINDMGDICFPHQEGDGPHYWHVDRKGNRIEDKTKYVV